MFGFGWGCLYCGGLLSDLVWVRLCVLVTTDLMVYFWGSYVLVFRFGLHLCNLCFCFVLVCLLFDEFELCIVWCWCLAASFCSVFLWLCVVEVRWVTLIVVVVFVSGLIM